MSYLPDGLRSAALREGCPEDDVEPLWERHRELCTRDGSDYGGQRWIGLVRKHVADLADGTAVPTVPRTVSDERRAAEERARKRANAAYALAAMPISEYMDALLTKAAPTDAERLLVFAGVPRRDPVSGEWLESPAAFLWRATSGAQMAAFARWCEDTGEEPPRPAARVHACPCGAPAASWLVQGRRYYGGRCDACIQREKDQRRRRAAEGREP